MARILVIDDDPKVRRLLARLLPAAGFDVVERATGMAGLIAALRDDYDLIILELTLPDVAGEHVLHVLMTRKPSARVLVLSCVTEVGRRVAALECGALDFVAKPFSSVELVARIRVRARAACESSPTITKRPKAAEIQLNMNRRTVISEGREIGLSQREFALASYLLEHRGEACSRSAILAEVWNMPFDPRTNIVDVCVRRLRAKLGDDKIETIRNVGYRFVQFGIEFNTSRHLSVVAASGLTSVGDSLRFSKAEST